MYIDGILFSLQYDDLCLFPHFSRPRHTFLMTCHLRLSHKPQLAADKVETRHSGNSGAVEQCSRPRRTMDTCRHTCVKYIILVFNLLFALAGLVIVGLGTYIQLGARHYLDFLDSAYLNIPILFIILGAE